MEPDYTDEELREITQRKKEEITQEEWTPRKIEREVHRASREKEDYEEWKRAREKSRQYAKGRKGPRRGKGKNRRKLPKSKYTIIENEFLEAAYKQYFRPNEIKALLFLIRKTWGWGKESDFIALKQFSQELGIGKNKISGTLSALRKRRIVTQLGNKTYAIQTDTSLWRDKPKKKRVKKG